MMRLLFFSTLLACAEPEPELEPCNGSPILCSRSLAEIAVLTTHNAMSNHEDGWGAPNQFSPIDQQLKDGVRGLMLDIYDEDGLLMLCHGVCWAGSLELATGLGFIAEFLRENPRELLTLILENYSEAEDLLAAFDSAGLADQLHLQNPQAPWPSLQQMIDSKRRLVVLTDTGETPSRGILAVWEHAFDTPYAAQTADDLSCELGRGAAGNSLFILNNFLTAPLPAPELAETVNFNPFLLDRAKRCGVARDHLANFVTVDFYNLGDAAAVVDTLNAASAN
jgi:hypothetical protein